VEEKSKATGCIRLRSCVLPDVDVPNTYIYMYIRWANNCNFQFAISMGQKLKIFQFTISMQAKMKWS